MSLATDLAWLGTVCAQNGIHLSEEQLALLGAFSERLLEWNKKINLISRRDEDNFWTNHILHSLSVLSKVDLPYEARILDLGTGGGLPGVPLRIARPDLVLTLLDATQKKMKAVGNMLDSLGITGVDLIWARAEDLGKKEAHKHLYDIVIARAVAPLRDLIQWSIPLLRERSETVSDVRGEGVKRSVKRVVTPTLIALKGGNLEDELGRAKSHPRVHDVSVINLSLSGSSQLEDGDKKMVLVDFTSDLTQKAN
jgi:16S rRNA (guanine527-N7)-methyltransferase